MAGRRMRTQAEQTADADESRGADVGPGEARSRAARNEPPRGAESAEGHHGEESTGQVREEVRSGDDVPMEHRAGVWSDKAGPVDRPNVHDIMRVEEGATSVRIHIELPPVEPEEVVVDVTAGQVQVIVPQGEAREVYCTVDLPLGVDSSRMEQAMVRGHLELVFPRNDDPASPVVKGMRDQGHMAPE